MRIMKKILLIIGIALMLASCASDLSKGTRTGGEPIIKYTYDQSARGGFVTGESHGKIDRIQKFEFEGHQYIQFWAVGTHGGTGGVVHDPDCPCDK